MSTKQILSILNVLAWIAFIGLCIKTGTLMFNLIFGLFMSPDGLKDFYLIINLSDLAKSNPTEYLSLMSLLIFVSGLQAYLFFLTTRLFEKINLENPFTEVVSRLILRISYTAFEIGILSIITQNYAERLLKKGLFLPDINEFVNSSAEFIFLAGIIYIIAQIFKRGIELQNENDLTI
ncbi:DUF2975 domain-containing protein [Chryseobacterium sp. FH1]|uniref:DUF2975 domain-containing protein n=1 Tax=Chryseobacterium sp. FH1 TaxID=1233951 RepID=UPI0004E3D4F1|nr:DUF2975 domain-containing protein [Chryseobacterium sp. FH1]KFC19248.1 hypothetical protein IO90_08000 [Chryseobacterium sp. FH1]